jgi:thiamine pyrophosphate-dependent acetolactate synthase large subunit-like protein
MSGIPELLEMWLGSTRPVILMGAGARKAAPEIIAFAEKWDIPIRIRLPSSMKTSLRERKRS